MFEVLLALRLKNYYGMEASLLEKELANLETELSRFLNGDRRNSEQGQRADLLFPLLIQKIDNELVPKLGKPIDIQWVGRAWQARKSLSDIDIEFESGSVVGISVKSTRTGSGTQKNLGTRSLKEFLDLDLTKETEVMWKRIRDDLKQRGGELKDLSQEGKTTIRESKYKYPIIQEIGKKYGYSVQQLAVEESVKLFNNLSPEKKLKFVEHILGIEESKPLLNAGVRGAKPYLYWNKRFNELLTGTLEAKVERGGKCYYITVGNTPVLRIQANFTNGIGLSAFCERAFLIVEMF